MPPTPVSFDASNTFSVRAVVSGSADERVQRDVTGRVATTAAAPVPLTDFPDVQATEVTTRLIDLGIDWAEAPERMGGA